MEFWNGTSVDAAKIEGNQAYKDMMRSLDIRDPTINDHAQLPGRIPGDCRVVGSRPQHDVLSPLVCSLWEEPLKDMLAALRDSVAIYLPRSTTFSVVVAVPFPTSALFRESVRSIGSSLSLKVLYQIPAAEVVSMKLEPPFCIEVRMGTIAMHDGYDLVLAIDYTRAALTAMMLAGRCDGYHAERVLHDTSFGADGMSREANHSRVALKHALQQLTTLPMKCRFDGTRFDSIQRVILFGDGNNDTRLREVLGEVLQDRRLQYQVLGRGAFWSMFESAFDVARYAAQSCARTVHRSVSLASGIMIH